MDILKLEAAKRQLDTAIKLYFKDDDPVSIHTLTAAAHQILIDLAKPEGTKSILKDQILILIKKEYQSKYLSAINEAENFFKHAEKDPGALLKFNPEQTDFLLFDAVEMYMRLSKESTQDMSIYRAWFLLKHPDFISIETKNKLKEINVNYIQYPSTINKLEFYQAIKISLI